MACRAATVEGMSNEHETEGSPKAVDGNPCRPQRNALAAWMAKAVALFAALAMALGLMAATLPATADETASPSDSESPSTATQSADTSNITDTQNLLGSDLSRVSDAIKRTKDKTGVTVRLLYLASFNTDLKPSQWASNLLDSLDPAPNTVMLAVASNDGNLVVAVSSNSDEWLKNSATVDDITDAALKPILDSDDSQKPDWAQSAIDMMSAIETAKQTATTKATSHVGIIVLVIVLVLIVAIIVFMIVWRRKHKKKVGRHADTRTIEDFEKAGPGAVWHAASHVPEEEKTGKPRRKRRKDGRKGGADGVRNGKGGDAVNAADAGNGDEEGNGDTVKARGESTDGGASSADVQEAPSLLAEDEQHE